MDDPVASAPKVFSLMAIHGIVRGVSAQCKCNDDISNVITLYVTFLLHLLPYPLSRRELQTLFLLSQYDVFLHVLTSVFLPNMLCPTHWRDGS